MAYYDYNGVDKPETEIANSSYDAGRRFLCDGAVGDTSCDFGYADWPAEGDGTAVPTMDGELEQVTHSQAWSKDTRSHTH